MFEKATRQKLRFQTSVGLITTEDLWDLPLQGKSASLDSVAIALNKEIKALGEESFVSDKPVGNTTLNLKLDIVKHIIAVKKAERDASEKAAEKRATKQKIMTLIAQKQDQELAGKGLEDLQKMLQELGE